MRIECFESNVGLIGHSRHPNSTYLRPSIQSRPPGASAEVGRADSFNGLLVRLPENA